MTQNNSKHLTEEQVLALRKLWVQIPNHIRKQLTQFSMGAGQQLGPIIGVLGGMFPDGKEEQCRMFIKKMTEAVQTGDWEDYFGIKGETTPTPIPPSPDRMKPVVIHSDDEPEEEEVIAIAPTKAEAPKPLPKPVKVEAEVEPEPDEPNTTIVHEPNTNIISPLVDAILQEMTARGISMSRSQQPKVDVYDTVKEAMQNGAFPEDRVRKIVREEIVKALAVTAQTLTKG